MSKLLTTLPQQPLDAETEALAAKCPDKTSLVMSAMKEACLYMTKCCRSRLPEDEIYSLAYSALCKAAGNFRPNRGTRFLGYSKPYLRGEIAREWRAKDIVRSASVHETESEKYPTSRTSEDGDGFNRLEGVERNDDQPIHDEHAEPEFSLIDLHEKWLLIEPILHQCLNEHERTILSLHYQAGLSFVEIAKMVVPKVSRSAIQNTHTQALRKIRVVLFRSKRLYSQHY